MRTLLLWTLVGFANSSAPARAQEPVELMTCSLGGKGYFRVSARNQRVNLEFDAAAADALGTASDEDLPAALESYDSTSTNGAVHLLEVGAGYFTNDRVGRSNCGLGLEFSPKISGDFQELLLSRERNYHYVSCEGRDGQRRKLDVASCVRAPRISSVTDFKRYVKIEIGD